MIINFIIHTHKPNYNLNGIVNKYLLNIIMGSLLTKSPDISFHMKICGYDYDSNFLRTHFCKCDFNNDLFLYSKLLSKSV